MPRYPFSRFLNIRNAHSPAPSPDGSSVAFLCDTTGVPQVWSVPIEGGWPEQLTFYTERVSSLVYSPSGECLVFGMDTGGNERQGLYRLSPDGSVVEPLEYDPEVIHTRPAWSPDSSCIAYAANRRDQRYFDIYVRPLDGEPRMVLQQDGTNSVVAWSADGGSLLVSRQHTPMNNDLYLLDLSSGEARLLTEHEDDARYSSACFAGENRLLLVTDRERDFLAPARIDLSTGELSLVDDHGWDAEEITTTADGRVVAYTVNEDGYSRLSISVEGRRVPVVGLPDGVLAGLELSRDGSLLVLALHAPALNMNVWAVNTATGQARQVTHASCAGIPPSELAEPELVRYESFDGLQVPAFLYRPRGADGPVPVVVHVHGGPESQARPVLNPTIQYLVHRGFGVLATNVRGSTGYGERYTRLDDVRKRMDSVADLGAAVRWLVAEGAARPDGIAVMGGSYGGFMVLAALTTYPDLWAAGVDTAGIANFVTFLENTGPWRRKLREAEYGSLEHDRDFLESISPINRIERIRAPLLVIHGANDPRVPVGEAEQIVESLRSRGRPVEYLCYGDEGHGLVRLQNKVHSAEFIASFLDKYLAGGKAPKT